MKRAITCLCVFFFVSSPLYSQQPPNAERIVPQPNAPIQIAEYSAMYQAASRSTYSSNPSQVAHSVGYRNVSGRTVTAIRFGFVEFNMFNEYMDKFMGYDRDTVKSDKTDKVSKSEFANSGYKSFAFDTGVVYVDRVRFDNGEIWACDLEAVLAELQKIEKDFDASILKPKDEPDKK